MQNHRLTLFLFIILICGSTVQARSSFKPTAWLLVGLDKIEGEPLGLPLNEGESREGQLQRLFTQSMTELGFKARTRLQAKQNDLYSVIQDPNTVAIFWIGHGRQFNRGLASPPGLLVDAEGNDLAPLFQQIHPNTKYIGLIGCESDAVFQAYKLRGHYDHLPFLKFGAFHAEDITEPTSGLLRELNQAQKWFSRVPLEMVCKSETAMMKVQVDRSTDIISVEPAPAVRIELRGRVLASMPPLNPGDMQRVTLWIKADELNSANQFIDFEVLSSSVYQRKTGLGQFTFTSVENQDLQWRVLENALVPTSQLSHVIYSLNHLPNQQVKLLLGRGPC